MLDKKTDVKIRNYFEYLLDHSTAEAPMWNQEKIRSGHPNKWNYIDGCMITAVLSMYELTQDQRYLDFADRFVGWFVVEDGGIRTYDAEEKNLDNINAARNLFPLYQLTGREKYRKAMDTVRHQLDIQPRTASGSFWHKDIYPNQIWLDGLYMAQPFYMQYETELDKMQGCRDSFEQFVRVEKFMKDAKTGLYYHGYDESRQMYWADTVTGCSPNFWLRALGWFACALVETADVMHESLYYERRYLMKMLENLAKALEPWQDESGMFYQVIDHPEAEGNYLETSGTALLAYALMKGARLDYLPARFADMGEKAFRGIVDRYLFENEDGTLGLGGICLVAGLGGPQRRDGSLAYYFSEPVVKNEAKGTAPFILAYTEMLRRQ
ncbi:unsaturated rhamnogalacturonyl hydrolase [Lachnospiraceae bacterium NK3A20]|nr:unsaturated rhamnogalacturonyl hydrolase [Lachnospiraceae bacterium NK3A20]